MLEIGESGLIVNVVISLILGFVCAGVIGRKGNNAWGIG